MILQSLSSYYHRLHKAGKAPGFGFALEKVGFCLVLSPEGELVDVQDLREQDGNKYRPRLMEAPFCNEVGARAVNIQPAFLVDNAKYVLGLDPKGKPKRLKECHEAFRNHFQEVVGGMDAPEVRAIGSFLERWDANVSNSLIDPEQLSGVDAGRLAFRMDGAFSYVHEKESIRTAWVDFLRNQKNKPMGFCAVSGSKARLQRLFSQFTGVPGAQSSGASLISFNEKAYESYNKEQGYNAPVGIEEEFALSTALKKLLFHQSNQKIRIGDTTAIFWAERETPLEGFFGLTLDPEKASETDQLSIRRFLEAVRDGKMPEDIDPEIRFFILGIAPNAARLSVRFWHESTAGEMAEKIGRHYADIRVARSFDKDPEFPPLWLLLKETSVLRKTENLSPVLAGSVMRSVLTGGPYPQALLTAVLGRIRADQNVNYLRAALIKGVLARKKRLHNIIKEEVTMALDKESTNPGYLLGRLFAVLEKAQTDALGKIGSTIKDRYFSSASSTPRAVFPNLIRLAQHHLAKSDYGPSTDRKIQDIMQGLETFPAHLPLDDQGFFALGYYHQKQDLYTKKNSKEEK